MSSALVLASVTAVLKNLLENGLVDHGVMTAIGSDTAISTLPPDRITIGSEEKPQLNLFLYQVTPKGLYSTSRHARAGQERPRPGLPLSMELHYLLTAYGAQDLQSEILLGYALQMLHASAEMSGPVIRATLDAVSSPEGGRVVQPVLAALAASDQAAQLQQINICPQALDSEEMVNLWSSFQVCYRPSVTYKVTVEMSHADEPGG